MLSNTSLIVALKHVTKVAFVLIFTAGARVRYYGLGILRSPIILLFLLLKVFTIRRAFVAAFGVRDDACVVHTFVELDRAYIPLAADH